MFTKGRAAVIAFVLASIAVAGAAVALAAGSAYTPKLGAPNGKHVKPGQIQLTAKIKDAKKVYVWITRKHKVKQGRLVQCTTSSQGCVVSTMKHKGQNKWVYKSPKYNFNGWFATTPGKYYWQVQSFAKRPPCKFGGANGDCAPLSKVGTFTVR
jgi:hypothetical protein